MEEIYISMKDASDLEGMLYRTFMKQVSRREENAEIVLRKEKILSGGKERKYIKLTDLSPKAQKAYRAMKKIDTEEGSDIVMENLPPEEPWYLDTDVNWYREPQPGILQGGGAVPAPAGHHQLFGCRQDGVHHP